MKPQTARSAARHGAKRDSWILSPWSGRLLPVVAAARSAATSRS